MEPPINDDVWINCKSCGALVDTDPDSARKAYLWPERYEIICNPCVKMLAEVGVRQWQWNIVKASTLQDLERRTREIPEWRRKLFENWYGRQA